MRALAGDDPSTMDDVALRELLGWVFCARRKVDRIFAVVEPHELAAGIADAAARAGRDRRAVRPVRRAARPAARRRCRPARRTAALPRSRSVLAVDPLDVGSRRGTRARCALVTMDEADLDAGEGQPAAARPISPSGRPMAFVEETGKAAGFTDLGPGLFGTDVFLAAVYGVYMQTVLGMRMTKEFTSILPAAARAHPAPARRPPRHRQEGLTHARRRTKGPADCRRVRRRHGRLDASAAGRSTSPRTGTGCSSRG